MKKSAGPSSSSTSQPMSLKKVAGDVDSIKAKAERGSEKKLASQFEKQQGNR
jgi:hypothetical protein